MHKEPKENARNRTSKMKTRPAHRIVLATIGIVFSGTALADAHPRPQEPQGEVIGTIEGQAIAVKGPMSGQGVGNAVKTLLRTGVDVRVKVGRAPINLAG